MATQTGSTYIAESTTYIINISTGYSTYASSEKVFTSKCDIDKQPEIAIWLPKPEVLISPKV